MGRLENNYYKTKDFIFKSDKDKRYADVLTNMVLTLKQPKKPPMTTSN